MLQIRNIAILVYPGTILSAVYGLQEMFNLANMICHENQLQFQFAVEIIYLEQLIANDYLTQLAKSSGIYQAVIIPPALQSDFHLAPDEKLLAWLVKQHKIGSILCSACVGTFLLAATDVIRKRAVTTHWKLAQQFAEKYPSEILNVEKILINHGDIITAGGLMSWIDLGLELVAQFSSVGVMRQLGKNLIVDTGVREQRYYQSFMPNWAHSDKVILAVQYFLQDHFAESINTKLLAQKFFVSERTFLRRFVKATSMKPTEYMQKLRIQKACELIETTAYSFDLIAEKVGYNDLKSFRKVFIKIMGLTLKQFRQRFMFPQYE